jgi:photosystem II stability/assembly factor-like uncharacterized protein
MVAKMMCRAVIATLVCAMSVHAAEYSGWAVGDARHGYGTIMHSEDSGATWVRQGSGQVANIKFSGVFAVSPQAAWVVGEADGGYATVYHTINGGGTWTRKGYGQVALTNLSGAKVHVSNGHVWVVAIGGIIHSPDNGATWENVTPDAYTNTLLQGVFTLDGTTVWVTGETNTAIDVATVLKTTNAGQTWTRYTNGLDGSNHLLGISAADADTLWAVGGGGYLCYTSTDGGESWTQESNPGGLGDGNEVYAISTDMVWMVADRYIGWSTNAGVAWSSANTPEYTMGCCAVSELEAWACSYQTDLTGTVKHTDDGGQTFDTQITQDDGVAPLWNISFAREPIPEPCAGIAVVVLAVLVRHRRTT